MIRSLYVRILVGFGAILVLTLLGIDFALRSMIGPNGPGGGPDGFLFRTMQFQHQLAEEALREGGVDRLRQFLVLLDRSYQGRHFLIDPDGIDLVDGIDRSSEVPPPPPKGFPGPPRRRGVVCFPPSGGTTRLLVRIPSPPFDSHSIMPYFSLLVVAVVAACLLVAYRLIRPLSRLRKAVSRFGRGQLDARAHIRRGDEIGLLASEFDRMADRLAALLAAERRLLQDVSHELRSPLARLAFAVELVESGIDKATGLGRVRKEVQRLTDLVGELIELTRVEGDPNAGCEVEVDLVEIVREVVRDGEVEATAKGCRLVTEYRDSVWVVGRAVLFHRAVENVVRNAIRHTPEGSDVEVRVGVDVGRAWLTVRDRGPGVAEEFLESIFVPFFRVDDDRSNRNGGVGLGLAISRRAIAVHHGRISARNAKPGLEVLIEVPLTPSDEMGPRQTVCPDAGGEPP
jgi:signal transduction histidine kinase